MAVPIAGHRPVHSATTTPSFAPKVIASEPIQLQPTTPTTTAETAVTPPSASGYCAPASAASVQQFEDRMHPAVQLTFSLEIASMQLAPTLKMSGLALQPTSKVVSMRLAPSQDLQPQMKLPVTFEVVAIELAGNTIGTVRLSPSSRQIRPCFFLALLYHLRARTRRRLGPSAAHPVASGTGLGSVDRGIPNRRNRIHAGSSMASIVSTLPRGRFRCDCQAWNRTRPRIRQFSRSKMCNWDPGTSSVWSGSRPLSTKLPPNES